jgi:hypothetical protein
MFLPTAGADTQNRLLPPGLPFGFFAAAVVYHAAGWSVLLFSPEPIISFRGGPGPAPAALHLMTLGVLVLTAMGAGLQLLPMAGVRPVKAIFWVRVAFWLTVPGVGVLTWGMAAFSRTGLTVGGGAVAVGLAVFLALCADNLRGAGDMPAVRRCGGVALAAGAVTTLLGTALAFDFHQGFLPDRAAVVTAHLGLGLYGFMGMLVAGFSTILLPMLLMAPAPPARSGLLTAQAAAIGLALVTTGALFDNAAVTLSGVVAGLVAAALHLHAMAGVFKARMRRRLDAGLHLIRGGWVGLVFSLLAAGALVTGAEGPFADLPAAFVFSAVTGWLLPTALGVLQRIAPFLAAIHAARPGGRMPLISKLVPEKPLQIHAGLHGAATVLLIVGCLSGSEVAARVGACLGVAGAFCLLYVAATLYRRARAHLGEN